MGEMFKRNLLIRSKSSGELVIYYLEMLAITDQEILCRTTAYLDSPNLAGREIENRLS